MTRRWLVIALLALTLGPIPIVGWLGWRTIDSLRDSVSSLGRQGLEEAFASDLSVALSSPQSPLSFGRSFSTADDASDSIAVAEDPSASFLTDPRLLRARSLARKGQSIEALESLSPWLAPREPSLESVAARLTAADIMNDRGRREHAGALLENLVIPKVSDAGAGHWIDVRSAIALGDDEGAQRRLKGWLDELEQRATSVGEIALAREALSHACGDWPADDEWLRARLRWPTWAKVLKSLALDPPKPSLVAIDEVTWLLVRDGRAQQVFGVAEWIEEWSRKVAPSTVERLGPLTVLEPGKLTSVQHVLGSELTIDASLAPIAFPAIALVGDPRMILLAALPLYALLALSVVLSFLQQRRRALELADARGDLIAHVTHELRTPLTVLRMYAETLKQGRVAEDRRERYLTTMGREAARLGLLVDRVAAEARSETVETAEREAIALDPLLRRLAGELGELQSTPIVVASDERDLRVIATEEELRMICEVLLDNALRYAPTSGAIEVSLVRNDAVARIAVRDHGPGIPALERGQLFTRWHRGSAAKQSGRSGAGMGLYLARRTARALDGDLTLDFPADGGTLATLTLPLIEEAP
jgi:signal transduction histidine kinase